MPTTELVAEVEGRHVPSELKDLDVWVLWDEREKVPLAPWATGDMYRAGWGAGVVADPDSRMEERPETDYETARMFADITPRVLHDSHSFPRDDDGVPDIPETVTETMLLPHQPPDPPLMQVDFDDVRDPETGAIGSEVASLLDRLDAYTEVSVSGAGLHCYVRAELPGGLGKFIADLDGEGAIELYDHGRFTACTWQHVAGTPTAVPERQDVIGEIVREYETESLKRRREETPDRDDRDIDAVLASMRTEPGDDGGNNQYYHAPRLEDVVNAGRYGSDYFRYKSEQRGWHNGPHPAHGPEHSDIDECTNFGVNGQRWNCFLHEGGRGGALHLLAVVEGVVSCDEAHALTDRPADLARTCLHARELESGLEGADPPYKALVGVAESQDLIMAEPDDNILGKDCWKIARVIYDEMEPGDL